MDFLKLFGKSEKKSKNVAKDRLKLVLVNDRSNVSPRFLEMVKSDIIKVISEYMIVDEEAIDIKITKTRSSSEEAAMSALIANIPIKEIKANYND